MLKKEKKASPPSDSTTITTLLGKDTVIEGTLTFTETIRVDGQIRGKLMSKEGTAIIGETAVLAADVQVGVAIIRGKIDGRVDAAHRIEIYAPAQVNGDIAARTVAIDSGVQFNGNCKMDEDPPPNVRPAKNVVKASAVADEPAQKI
ncbi:MAG: polymer-forming cytoskeletal protein [Desulfatitalea sp.]|nr:polymer-forming cytoskeletal protein [Desulfatitalea sp.]NNK01070.1 polymer-forming cytoskeletal protein [Desulfatitalea sp.]